MRKSKYKYVYFQWNRWRGSNARDFWEGNVYDSHEKRSRRKVFKEERDAAIWVDKTLLQLGKEPVNILKKVK